MRRILSSTLLLITAVSVSRADVLWDNGMIPDGRAGNPVASAAKPDIVLAEDFRVPEGPGWSVTGFRYVMAVDAGWEDGGVTAIRVCTDSGGEGPLSPIYYGNHRHTKRLIGVIRGGYKAYEFTVDDVELDLGPSTYWFGPNMTPARGHGFAYWLTTDAGGVRDRGDMSWFSPDAMETWFRGDETGWANRIGDDTYWHQGFQILGRVVGAAPQGESVDSPDDRPPTVDESMFPSVEPVVEPGQRPIDSESPLSNPTLLWDNGLRPNGYMGRAISPPAFPNIRVAEDIVAGPNGWIIREAHINVIEDGGWEDGGVITMLIFADTGNGPGKLLRDVTTEFTKMDTGDDYFGRSDYDYWIEGMNVELAPGSYWVGFRNPKGGGAGTNYWMSSDGGRDGPGTRSGWFSLDGGDTWTPEGINFIHCFELWGEPSNVPMIRPHFFEVMFGVTTHGGLLSLVDSDDDRLEIAARRPSSVSKPSAQIVLEGRTEDPGVTRLTFHLEAAASVTSAIQWIDLYDFEAGAWVRLDTRTATREDSVVEVVPDDAGRFVDPTGLMRARVSHWDPGIPIAGWSAQIDQAVWIVAH
jgi:hypothetical protein